jgi:hypothetical protein
LHGKKQSRLESAIFTAKTAVLRGIRSVSDLTQPVRQLGRTSAAHYRVLLGESSSFLWTAESEVENSLQFGKVQNLRKACLRLHSVEVRAGQVFSFWKQIGRARRSAGYALGRELRQGCLIPSVGGGLCQLSNSLYDLALQSGCDIIERHAHSSIVPGSAAEQGRDATVFWNYVDLRFRAKQSILITAILNRDKLVVRFWGTQKLVSISSNQPSMYPASSVNTCTDCGVSECFRHSHAESARSDGHSAFLIEECWPEFETFALKARNGRDHLFLPYSSKLKPIERYKWNSEGYARTISANKQTLLAAAKARFHRSHLLPPVASQLGRSQLLADFYGDRLSIDISHVYVAQSLLPFLWRRGDLGGRRFSVLMTRLPLRALHHQLDALATRYPERKTFQEFRAPSWMVDVEAEALDEAGQIITPHAVLATLFPLKTNWLKWKLPQVAPVQTGDHIVFPGPALARKGACEIRDVLRSLDRELLVLNGHASESDHFWDGIQVHGNSADWIRQAAVVVQPAFVENNPRPLLRALAAGVPVIATRECGIDAHSLLELVPAGDVEALKNAITGFMSKRTSQPPVPAF